MENTEPKLFQIFAKLLDGKTATLRFTTPYVNGHHIKQRIFDITKIPITSQRLICSGAQVGNQSIITTPESTVHLVLRLLGGKGGFGSLLRGAATKAGQKKTNNFDACRDMSGRRLRHVNAEKRLDEWKAEQEDRKLEKMAEEFIKKKAKKGKKGVGDGEAEKYVEKYRKDSAKCAAEVEEAVREACGNGNGKRKLKVPIGGVEAKRLKIWMGKRKLAESDSDMEDDSSDDDHSDEENEKSIIIDNSNHPDLSKEAEGSLESVTGGKQEGGSSGGASCESGSEEEKEVAIEESMKTSLEESVPNENEMAKSEIHKEMVEQNASVTCLEAAIEATIDEKLENVTSDSQPQHVSNSGNGETIEISPVIAKDNGFSDSKSEDNGETVVANVVNNAELEKPLNFAEFSSAAELELLGMERLKSELQAHGLKCGGTLQERAARLFLLKSTPIEKLPKKLLAKK